MVLDPWWDAALVGVLGLMVGSFLNVVIYRLPRMMERQWAREHADYARSTAGDTAPAVEPPDAAPFNLAVPRSRCQSEPGSRTGANRFPDMPCSRWSHTPAATRSACSTRPVPHSLPQCSC